MSDTGGTPKKKFAPTAEQYKKAIKALSKIGAVNYSVSDNLSKSQRATLRAKMQEYAHYIKRPDDFVVRKVSADTAEVMKKSGIKATATNRAVIPKKGFDTIKVEAKTTTRIKRDEKGEPLKDKRGRVKKEKVTSAAIKMEGRTKRGAKISEKATLVGGANFEAHIRHLAKKKLKKNQVLSIKIGENATLSRTFQNMSDLVQYVKNIDFKIARGKTRADVERLISVVEIEGAPSYAKKTQAKKK